MLTFTVNGDAYDFDQNKLSLAEAIIIEVELGLTIATYTNGIRALSAKPLQAMVWLAKRRAGEAVRLQDIEFDCMELIDSFRYETPPGEAEPDPPVGQPTLNGSDSGTTHDGDAPSTSELSPTT